MKEILNRITLMVMESINGKTTNTMKEIGQKEYSMEKDTYLYKIITTIEGNGKWA